MKPNLSRLYKVIQHSKPKQVKRKPKFDLTNLIAIFIATLSLAYAIYSGKQQSIITQKQTELLDSLVCVSQISLENDAYALRPLIGIEELVFFGNMIKTRKLQNHFQLTLKNNGIKNASDIKIHIEHLNELSKLDSIGTLDFDYNFLAQNDILKLLISIPPKTDTDDYINISIKWKDSQTNISYNETKYFEVINSNYFDKNNSPNSLPLPIYGSSIESILSNNYGNININDSIKFVNKYLKAHTYKLDFQYTSNIETRQNQFNYIVSLGPILQNNIIAKQWKEALKENKISHFGLD